MTLPGGTTHIVALDFVVNRQSQDHIYKHAIHWIVYRIVYVHLLIQYGSNVYSTIGLQ
jgi:uncharacterized MAPEG superfamily protein